MATLVIPVTTDAEREFVIELDGRLYGLRFKYNERRARWTMDVLTGSGEPVVCGIPMLTNSDLLSRFILGGLPPGKFLVYDETGAGSNPTRDNFGVTVKLLYREVGT